MNDWLRGLFADRPTWMNVLMVFCGYMAFVYLPWDLFVKPVDVDEEVWFGVLFHGWTAKLLEPFHWAVYAAGAYGFRSMRPWMWPWAAIYAGQIAIGMLVWGLLYGPGGFGGFAMALIAFTAFAALTRALWRARPLFEAGTRSLSERYGGWAVITGASAGLGEAFARALAREGISCVLSARREDRLRRLADELSGAHAIETRIVSADLAKPEDVLRLADAVADLDVSIVVNNAGFGMAGRFAKLDSDRLCDMIQVNCAAPVALTSRLLPKLRDRGRGAVIVTGSVAGRLPLPLHAVYSATKAFDLHFGESLAAELADENIDVLVLEPGPTATEFQAVAREVAHEGEPAADVVAVALQALGRRPTVISGWNNWLRGAIAPRLLPRSLLAHLAHEVMAEHTERELR
ncbi:MAG: SDR family NAD(P)-dependent oxidoreductase [Myxococcota bacterium]